MIGAIMAGAIGAIAAASTHAAVQRQEDNARIEAIQETQARLIRLGMAGLDNIRPMFGVEPSHCTNLGDGRFVMPTPPRKLESWERPDSDDYDPKRVAWIRNGWGDPGPTA